MDDLTAKVQEILGSEEGMRQIQEMAKALGLSNSTPPPAGSGLSGLLSGPCPCDGHRCDPWRRARGRALGGSAACGAPPCGGRATPGRRCRKVPHT